jgi:septal ring factor EnvC (AmiA/AmiB activator)
MFAHFAFKQFPVLVSELFCKVSVMAKSSSKSKKLESILSELAGIKSEIRKLAKNYKSLEGHVEKLAKASSSDARKAKPKPKATTAKRSAARPVLVPAVDAAPAAARAKPQA